MNIDGIVFDLDGTLWDSSGSVIDSWNETISSYSEVKNKLTVDDMKSAMGLTIKDIASKFFPYLDEETRLNIIKNCSINECKYLSKHGAVLYNGLEETLKELAKKYKLFIVSNCQKRYIESFFVSHRLKKYFTDYEVSGRTGLTKSENLKLIIKRNNLLHPVYIGDTNGDSKAAESANVPFIYAKYGFGKAIKYDYSIDKFGELLELVGS